MRRMRPIVRIFIPPALVQKNDVGNVPIAHVELGCDLRIRLRVNISYTDAACKRSVELVPGGQQFPAESNISYLTE